MRLLNRYFFQTILASVLLVLLVICALDLLGKLRGELGDLTKTYTFIEALLYTALYIPLSVYNNTPFAALVGGLVGLGALANNSELVIMRAAGVSLFRITMAVLKPILLLIILSLLLAEYVIPTAEQYAENRRDLKLYGVQTALSSRRGLWNREGTEFMHFNSVEANGRLRGVTRYRFGDNNELLSSSFSKSAIYSDGRWQEEDVIETVVNDNFTQKKEYPIRNWDIELSPSLLSILVQESDNLSISKLHHYIGYLNQQNIDSGPYQLSFWAKVLQPAVIVGLVLIAVSFIFGPLREVTMGYRIFTGVIVGIAFQLAQKLFGPASLVYGFSPLVAVLVPIAFCIALGLFLLAKNR